MTPQQQQAFDAMREALERAKVEVSYMAGGMTHAAWKTQQAKDSLAVIDNALTAAKEVTAQEWTEERKQAAAKSLVDALAEHNAQQPAPAQRLSDAFDAGFRCAAGWAQRDDLFADIDSPTYKKDRLEHLNRIAEKNGITLEQQA